MTELQGNLTKATNSANFTAKDLNAALSTAGAVEGMALLSLLDRAATLAADIDRLLRAVQDDDTIAARLASAKEPTA